MTSKNMSVEEVFAALKQLGEQKQEGGFSDKTDAGRPELPALPPPELRVYRLPKLR
jgi:hypothetical protein